MTVIVCLVISDAVNFTIESSVNILFIAGIGIFSSMTGSFTSTVVSGVTPSVVISYFG